MRAAKSPDVIALEALAFIAAEEAEFSRFLSLSGLTVADLRDRAGASETLRAIMEYVMGHEPTARAFAESAGYGPEDLAGAARRLGAFA